MNAAAQPLLAVDADTVEHVMHLNYSSPVRLTRGLLDVAAETSSCV